MKLGTKVDENEKKMKLLYFQQQKKKNSKMFIHFGYHLYFVVKYLRRS